MELQLRSAEINLPQEIANLEALKAELAPKLEYYNNLVVTEDSIKAAKNDKANLNKLRTAIEDQRKAAKKQYLAPYEILEAQCKEVTALIDAPIAAIDKQLKVFEEIEKNDKFTALNAAFTEFNAPDWIDINDVLNPKWENKTQKLDALKPTMTRSCPIMLSLRSSMRTFLILLLFLTDIRLRRIFRRQWFMPRSWNLITTESRN